MKLDFVAADRCTVVARRTQKSPPGEGGWQLYHTGLSGVDAADPTNKFMRASGDKASYGWPSIPEVEAWIAAWYEAKSHGEEKVVAHRLNKAALDNVVYAPLGFYLMYQAWRRNVSGVAQGPLPLFRGVSKTD
jgi:peptide/nickel transport system substrate-binding protein